MPQTQALLFGPYEDLPQERPVVSDLKPAQSLLRVFEDCHNYIYANEGMLKDRIFQEIVKILLMKFEDEERALQTRTELSITLTEYRQLLEGRESEFVTRVKDLFSRVRKRYPDYFPAESDLRLSPLSLAYTVRQLQFISLRNTPADAKGDAFQTFVHSLQRGERGEFFTPVPIVNLAVGIVRPSPSDRVVDPAVGSGGFLIQTARYCFPRHAEADQGSDRLSYLARNVRGFDINPEVTRSAELRLILEGGSGREVKCENALKNPSEEKGEYDVVLTNPPFGSRGKIDDQTVLRHYHLGHRWVSTSKGEWQRTHEVLDSQAPEILFIERSLSLLKPGGRMAIVLPDGILQNPSVAYVRQWLRSVATPIAVVSLPHETFVPFGTGIKTSILFLRKEQPRPGAACFMAKVRDLGYDVKGQPVYKFDRSGRTMRDATGAGVLKEDISGIVSSFRTFAETGDLMPVDGAEIHAVPVGSLNSRLDVEHYIESDLQLIFQLDSTGAKQLGDISEIVRVRSDFRERPDETIRYVAISDVDYDTMQIVNPQEMQAHEAPSRATYALETGDIITATSGASTGTARHVSALVGEEYAGAICSNGFTVIRHVTGVDPLYLLAFMRSETYLRQVRRLMTGHAIPSLSSSDLASVLVPAPPEEVQHRIANEVRTLLNLRSIAKAKWREVSSLVEEATSSSPLTPD